MKKSMEEAAVEAYNAGVMCKGCFTKMIAPRDMNYKCPIHEVVEE